jgi:hypothetical protein
VALDSYYANNWSMVSGLNPTRSWRNNTGARREAHSGHTTNNEKGSEQYNAERRHEDIRCLLGSKAYRTRAYCHGKQRFPIGNTCLCKTIHGRNSTWVGMLQRG